MYTIEQKLTRIAALQAERRTAQAARDHTTIVRLNHQILRLMY